MGVSIGARYWKIARHRSKKRQATINSPSKKEVDEMMSAVLRPMIAIAIAMGEQVYAVWKGT